MSSDQIKENRLNNLILLAKKYSRPKLAVKLEISYNHLTQYIGKGGKTRTRNIGEEFARKIEEACGLPRYSLDQKHENIDSINKVYSIRLENLRNLEKKYGTRTNLAKAMKVSPNLLTQYIGKNPTINIGEEFARKAEDRLELEYGQLDQDHTKGVVIPTMSPDGEIVYPNKDELFFIPVVELKLIDLISQDDSFTSKKETKMITINEIKYFDIDPKKSIYTWTYSDVMYPVVKNGDMILIDLRESPIKHREKYLIKLRGEILPARIFDLGSNKLRISFDNKNLSAEYPDEEIDMKDIKIYGKIAQIITK